MFKIIKKENKIDKYELTKSVNIPDIKDYLLKEYERAEQRENTISLLEAKIEELTKISIKYDALLVVQQETQKRIEKQNSKIIELKEQKQSNDNEIKLLHSKITDIKINAENKLKEKDKEIKDLKKQLQEAIKPKKEDKKCTKKK